MLGERKSNLMFIPNPDFKGDISAFHQGLLWNYLPEYDLELAREQNYYEYPSRLNALYLFDSESQAISYSKIHPKHVCNRILKKCKSKGNCIYSIHDLSWIDFLRLTPMIDDISMNNIAKSYWTGIKVKDCGPSSFRKTMVTNSDNGSSSYR